MLGVVVDNKKQLRAKQSLEVKISLIGKMTISALGQEFTYKLIEKPPRLSKALQRKGYSAQLKRIAGYKSKLVSPWILIGSSR